MAKTHTFNPSVTAPSGSLSGTPQTYSGGEHVEYDETFAAGNNQAFALAFAVAKLKSIFILASTDATLETNDSGTPASTISLVGGIPYIWNEDSYFANLIDADVTSAFLTNAAECRLRISAIVDPT